MYIFLLYNTQNTRQTLYLFLIKIYKQNTFNIDKLKPYYLVLILFDSHLK